MRKWLKRLGKILGVAAVIVVAAALLALLFVQTGPGRNVVRGKVVDAIDAQLEGEIEVGVLQGNLLTWAELHDVVVRDGRGNVLARIPTVRADYAPLQLLRSELRVASVEVSRPLVVVRRYEDGALNLATLVEPEPAAEEQPPGEFRVSIQQAVLQDGLVVYLDDQLIAEEFGPSARSDLEHILEAIDNPDTTIDVLRRQVEDLLEEASTEAPAAASIAGLDLQGRVFMHGGDRLSARLESLDARVDTSAISGGQALEARQLRVKRSLDHLEVQADKLGLGAFARTAELRAAADFVVERDRFGNRAVVDIERFGLNLAEVELGAELFALVAPDAPIDGPLYASARLTGTPEQFSYVASAGCEADPSVTLAGTALFPGEDFSRAEYDMALLVDEFQPQRCLDIGGREAQLSGSLLVEGQGINPETLSANVRLGLRDMELDSYRVDSLYAEASAADGLFGLDTLGTLTPYGHATARGQYDLDGSYSVELSADANPEVRELVDQLGAGQLSTDFARVRAQSKGQLDLDAEAPLDMVQRADVSAQWRLRDVVVESDSVGSSSGDISASIAAAPDGDDRRQVEFSGQIDGEAIDVGQSRLGWLDFEASGSGRLSQPVDDPLEALEGLSSRWRLRARGVNAAATRISGVDLRVGMDRSSTQRPFAWTARGSVAGVRQNDLVVGRLGVDLGGTAAVDQTDEGAELGRVTARGAADLTGLATGLAEVGSSTVRVDLAGRPPQMHGEVELDARDIETLGEQIEAISATVGLRADQQFDLDAHVERSVPIDLESAGRIGDDFGLFEFERMVLSSADVRLELSPGASVRVLDNGVRFENFRLDGPDQFASLQGEVRTRGALDLKFELSNIQPGSIREGFGLEQLIPPVRGAINAEAQLTGVARAPVVATSLSIEDFHYDQYGPFDAALEFGYANEALQIDELRLSAYRTPVLRASGQVPLEFDLRGRFEVPDDRDMDLEATVPSLRLEDFYELLPLLEEQELEGVVSGHIQLGGTIRQPSIDLDIGAEDVAVSGDIGREYVELEQITTRLDMEYVPPVGQRGGITANYELDWRGQELVRASLSTPMPIARWVHQVLDPEQPIPDWADEIAQLSFALSLHLDRLDMGVVPLESFAEADAEGVARVDLRGDGTFSDPRIDFDAHIDGFGWNQYRNIFAGAEMQLRDEVIHIEELRTEWDGDEIFVAFGELPFPTDALLNGQPPTDLPIDLTAQLSRTPLSKLSAYDYEFARYEGELAAVFRAKGTLSDPRIEGRAGLFNAQMTDGQKGTIAASFRARNGRVLADASVCRFYDELVFARANLPINLDITDLAAGGDALADGELRVELKSEKIALADLIPAQLLSEFITDPEGNVEVDLQLAGTWEEPRVAGGLLLEDGAFTLPQFGRRFTDIGVDVRADSDQIEVVKARLSERNSWAELEATVGLDDFSPTQITAALRTKEFNVGAFADGLDAFVTSEIAVRGNLSGDSRQLTARATELEISVPETGRTDLHPTALHDEIIVLQRRTDAEEVLDVGSLVTSPEDAPERPTRYEVRFIAERGSWLRHPIGDVEFEANLTTEIGGPQVAIVGAVDTIRGEVEFVGKRFVVPNQENAILFTGASPPNPTLDLRAIYPLDRAIAAEIGEPSEEPSIVVRVRGRSTTPNLLLESDPAMTETEILFVLMTGRPPAQAEAGEESRVSGLAMGAASGIFAGMLQQRLAATLPVDVLRVEAGEGFRDVRVEFGKYITQNVFVSYTYEFGLEEDEAENIAKIEYRFAPRWKLETQYSDQMTGQFNIFWNIY
jgi:translocation and assembly module TamB